MAKKKLGAEFGFTLLELLIVLVISGVLLSALCQTYLSLKQFYRDQIAVVELSENLRFADFILLQNLIQAGFAGCNNLAELKLDNHTKVDFKVASNLYGYDSDNLPDYLANKATPGSDLLGSVN